MVLCFLVLGVMLVVVVRLRGLLVVGVVRAGVVGGRVALLVPIVVMIVILLLLPVVAIGAMAGSGIIDVYLLFFDLMSFFDLCLLMSILYFFCKVKKVS